MRRILIVLASFAVVSIAAETRVGAQSSSATASLAISASVAKNCTITTTPVAFGSYDSVTTNATAPLDGVGAVIVTCTKGAPAKVGLNDGGNAQGTTRRMSQGAADFLTYELYKDTGHATRWGNTADTSLDIPAAPSQTPRSFPVYGRVAPAQTAAVGSYTDTVMATVNF
jgi:spore coat protein U-like protein